MRFLFPELLQHMSPHDMEFYSRSTTAADSQPQPLEHIHYLQHHVTVLHLANHLPNTPQSLKERLVGNHPGASYPAYRQQLAPDTTPTPRDHRHRGEPTLERQHHDDHRGSSHTGARRAPAMPPALRTSGSRTNPASPPPLKPRL